MGEEDYDIESDYMLGEIYSVEEDFWCANVQVNNKIAVFKLDSGSKATVIDEKTPWIKGLELSPAKKEF